MASFGHVAVGMLTGRLHGGVGGGRSDAASSNEPRRRRPSWPTLVVFAGLALLPDADVLLVALGTCDGGVCGHRGASHSLPMAIAIGFLAGLLARRLKWPVLRTMIATTIAVGSHALLDVLGAGGRGLPLLWPFSDHRFISPIRIFPDAPRGLAFLSWPGLLSIGIEFVVFLPLMIFALWPRISAWRAARALARRSTPAPSLTFIEGGTAPAPAATSASSSTPASAVSSDEHDPPARSVG
jgi:inner membrane protein